MASFVPSQRGVFKLHYEGFIYVKQKENQLRTLWRCEKYRKCRGRASSINGDIIITAGHNHDPEPHMCEVATVLANIKAQSVNTEDAPKNIISKALTGLSEAALVKIPKIVSLKKAASRAKQRAAETPQDRAFRLLIAAQNTVKRKRPVAPIEGETYTIIRSQQEGDINTNKQNSTARISSEIPFVKQEDINEGFSGTLPFIGHLEESYSITTADGRLSVTGTRANDGERENKRTDKDNNVLQDNFHCRQKNLDVRVGRDEHSVYGEYIADRFHKCNRNKAEIEVTMKLIDGIMFNLATGIYSCISSAVTNEASEKEKAPSLSTQAFTAPFSSYTYH